MPRRAAEEFNRVVRHHEIPSDIQTVPLPEGVRVPGGIRVDKMIARTGLVESVSDAVRKIKAGAVEIGGERVQDLVWTGDGREIVVQVGKNWRKIII